MPHPNLVREHFTFTGKPKQAFMTQGEAMLTLDRRHWKAYKCGACHLWHRAKRKKGQ